MLEYKHPKSHDAYQTDHFKNSSQLDSLVDLNTQVKPKELGNKHLQKLQEQ